MIVVIEMLEHVALFTCIAMYITGFWLLHYKMLDYVGLVICICMYTVTDWAFAQL